MIVPLFLKGKVAALATIDQEDAELVNGYRWRLNNNGYAIAGKNVSMHRLLMDAPQHLEVDHEDRNRLNNTRKNLRLVTKAQQQQNLPSMGGTSQYRGVSFCKQTGRWRATVILNGKQHSCGRHETEEGAALAARQFRLQYMTHATD